MKPKTIREWLNTIEDDTIRSQAIENAEKHYSHDPTVIDMSAGELHRAIQCAFVWSVTKQGFQYWDEICDKARFGTLKTREI